MKQKITFSIPIWYKDEAIDKINNLTYKYENNISYELDYQMIFIKIIVSIKGKKELVNNLYNKVKEKLGEY